MDNNVNGETKTEIPENEKKKTGKASKYIIYIFVILIITGLTLYFSLRDSFDNIVSIFQNVDWINIAFAALCFLGGTLLDCAILYLFARRYKKKYYFHQAVANDMVGIFYNFVTPGQTGGQIMQAYTYKKQGISISNATSCLVMNFIVYQFVLIGYGVFSIAFKFKELMQIEPIEFTVNGSTILTIPIWVLTIIGFTLDLMVIALTFLMSYSKWFHKFITHTGVNIFAKLHLIKNPEKTRQHLSVQVESFKLELKNLFTNPVFLLVIFLLYIGSFTLKFMVPYYVGIAICGTGSNIIASYDYSLLDTICYSGFHKLIAELIPIPGSAGFSEFFFYTLFKGSYVIKPGVETTISALINSQQLIWRTITFHIPLVITGFVAALYRGKDKETFETASASTYVDLQMQTIAERRTNYETQYATRLMEKDESLKPLKHFFKHKVKDDDKNDKDGNNV